MAARGVKCIGWEVSSTAWIIRRRRAGRTWRSRDAPTAKIAGYAAIHAISPVSSGGVHGGEHRAAGPWPGIRAAVNARLEEVSFRTGMATGAIALLAFAAATAAVVITVSSSQGRPANETAGRPSVVTSPVAVAVPSARPSPLPTPSPLRTPAHRPREGGSPSSSASAAGSQSATVPQGTIPQVTVTTGQASSYPGPGHGRDSAGGMRRMRRWGAPVGYWPGNWSYRPGNWNGARMPRMGGDRGNFFPWGFWRP